MIRGYVAVVGGSSPLPQIATDSCRKAAIKLTVDNYEFYISVEGTDYSFKVVGNVRTIDKHNIAKGLARIGFTIPNLDIVISCNPEDLEVFLYTAEAINNLIKVLPPKCHDTTHEGKLKCICHGIKFSQYRSYHISDYKCPLSVSPEQLCAFCCYCILECYNDDDARKILDTWKESIAFADRQIPVHSITVTSYPSLRALHASGNSLVEIPEALGWLPCLTLLDLSDNRLGQATNWNWLTSPFIRENLHDLDLALNGLSVIPEGIGRLKNLKILLLNQNYLTELPATLGNLKYLRYLDIASNKMAILPTWVYHKEHFLVLSVDENDLLLSTEYNRPQLDPSDFETPAVLSLFKIVAKYIIINKLAYWEHNIPEKLVDYLQGAYYCRCGSVVFRDTIGQIVQCRISKKALAPNYCNDNDEYDYDNVAIAIRCCSNACFKLMERYITV